MAVPQPPGLGRGTFVAGSIVLVAFGAVHLLAVYHANFIEPAAPAEAALKRALQEHRPAIGPFKFSAWGTAQILNATYSILLLYAGAVSLVLLTPAIEHAGDCPP
jgi:hypothetical protein